MLVTAIVGSKVLADGTAHSVGAAEELDEHFSGRWMWPMGQEMFVKHQGRLTTADWPAAVVTHAVGLRWTCRTILDPFWGGCPTQGKASKS